MRLFFLLLIICSSTPVTAATYYVRTDGGPYGSTTTTCNGLSDDAYVADSGPNCAVNHPFEVIGVEGSTLYPQRIVGGDTVIISNGSYRMGHTVGVYDSEKCSSAWPWDCHSAILPAGTSIQHTRILGEDWDSGCATMPELYGVESSDQIFSLVDSDYAELQCLEITDHVGCVDSSNHGTRECNDTTYPYGDWATDGIYAYSNVATVLKNLNIHGIANNGIKASQFTGVEADNVTIRSNGIAGWNGTAGANNSSTGTLEFTKLLVEYNGCIESYPGLQPEECWAQQGGGYGDGFGLDATAGNWRFIDSSFLHNTSDGLDGLYLFDGATMYIERIHSEGNAGSQIKVSGDLITLINSKIIGNCNYFTGNPITASTEWDDVGDSCRAGGPPVNLAMTRGASTSHDAVVLNNTIVWESNYGVWLSESVGTCDKTETVYMRNNIWQANTNSLGHIGVGCTGLVPDVDYSIIYNDANGCGTQSNCSTANPLLTDIDFIDEEFNLNLSGDASPAYNTGLASGTEISFSTIPVLDYYGNTRTTADIGMHEFGGTIIDPDPTSHKQMWSFGGSAVNWVIE